MVIKGLVKCRPDSGTADNATNKMQISNCRQKMQLLALICDNLTLSIYYSLESDWQSEPIIIVIQLQYEIAQRHTVNITYLKSVMHEYCKHTMECQSHFRKQCTSLHLAFP